LIFNILGIAPSQLPSWEMRPLKKTPNIIAADKPRSTVVRRRKIRLARLAAER